jgi:hypothetical protein
MTSQFLVTGMMSAFILFLTASQLLSIGFGALLVFVLYYNHKRFS